jgi:hypothetical protein
MWTRPGGRRFGTEAAQAVGAEKGLKKAQRDWEEEERSGSGRLMFQRGRQGACQWPRLERDLRERRRLGRGGGGAAAEREMRARRAK